MALDLKNLVGKEAITYVLQKIKTLKIEIDGKINAKSDFSGNYVDLTNKPVIPTKNSQLTNDKNYLVDADIPSWAKAASKPTYTPQETGVIGTAPTTGQVAVFDGTTGKIKSTGFTISKSVPTDATFTDTTYTAAGAALGLVKTGGDVTISSGVISVNDKGYQTAAQVQTAITSKGYQTASQVAAAVANAGHLKRTIVSALPNISEANENTIYMVLKSSSFTNNSYDEWQVINGQWELMGDTNADLVDYVKKTDLVEIGNSEIDKIWNTVFGS